MEVMVAPRLTQQHKRDRNKIMLWGEEAGEELCGKSAGRRRCLAEACILGNIIQAAGIARHNACIIARRAAKRAMLEAGESAAYRAGSITRLLSAGLRVPAQGTVPHARKRAEAGACCAGGAGGCGRSWHKHCAGAQASCCTWKYAGVYLALALKAT